MSVTTAPPAEMKLKPASEEPFVLAYGLSQPGKASPKATNELVSPATFGDSKSRFWKVPWAEARRAAASRSAMPLAADSAVRDRRGAGDEQISMVFISSFYTGSVRHLKQNGPSAVRPAVKRGLGFRTIAAASLRLLRRMSIQCANRRSNRRARASTFLLAQEGSNRRVAPKPGYRLKKKARSHVAQFERV